MMQWFKWFERILVWRKNDFGSWIESFVFMGFFLIFLIWIAPDNPLFIHEMFPWPWLMALIIVLQYGLGPALFATVLIGSLAIYFRNQGMITFEETQSYLLSGITVMLVCSLYASSWARRMMNAEVVQTYNQERLDSLSRSFYMLRTSSEFLEQNIITQPMTLRLALIELQKLSYQSELLLSPEVGYSFLELLSQFCFINAAGIFLYHENQINIEPYVKIGPIHSLIVTDPLIQKCEELNQFSYVSVEQIEKANECHYLICIPLLTESAKRLGLLVIQEMPFWSLNDEIIRTLSILVYYFMHEVVPNKKTKKFLKHYPNANADFAKQLVKLVSLKGEMDIDSALVAVKVSKELEPYQVISHLKNQQRILDAILIYETKNFDILITVMPFTSSAGIQGYLTRIARFVSNDLGLFSYQKNQKIQMRSMLLENIDPIQMMDKFTHFIEEENFE